MSNWRDTVMNLEQIQCAEIHQGDILEIGIPLARKRNVAKAQAEISFKAGIREVIERYKKDNPSMYKKYQAYWEDLEEEWGIDNGKTNAGRPDKSK